MEKYKFNDDMPAEEAVVIIRAAERYVNAVDYINENVLLAILCIEKVKENDSELR